MGDIVYIAKVTRFVDRKLGVDISADQFGELWGKTKAEAEAKMTEKVDAWIASQEP